MPAKSLLIVDDSELTRTVLKELLEAEGYLVHEAADGEQALERLSQNERPALILLDLAMPVMHGLQFLDALKQRGQQDLLGSILVMSADRADLQKVEGYAVHGVFEKPFSLRELVKRVAQACPPTP